jgi:DNA repair exonuclease SbcCD nuclease subunit
LCTDYQELLTMHAVVTGDSHLAVSGRYFGLEGEPLERHRDAFFSEFDRVVDHALEVDTDCFIHCGDLFDVNHPDPARLSRVIERIRDLERAEIVPVFVTGNHDWSRVADGVEVSDPDALTPLHVLDAADVGVVFPDATAEGVTITVGEREVHVTGMGYHPAVEGEVDPLADVTLEPTDADHEIVVTHHRTEGHEGGLDGWPLIRAETIERLGPDALCTGHVHERRDFTVGDTQVVVPGASAIRRFPEADNEPGFYEMTLDDAGAECTFHRLDPQPVVVRDVSAPDDLPAGRETETLADRVREWAEPSTLLRVDLDDPDGRVDRSAIRVAGQQAFHFELA